MSKKCKWQQFKSNLTRVYGFAGSHRQGKMTSTDLRRTINAPTWTDFHLFPPKKLTTNVYKTKCSSTEWFISSINWEEVLACTKYVCARPKKVGKWGDVHTQQPITVTNERTGFLAVWKQPNEFQQIKQHRAIFVWMKNNKDFMKVRRKQSYNKHLIRWLTSQYGWVFLLVELYFGSPKGSPKYCRLIKIPSHIGWSTV